jgi:sulfatase maturation enzyme AslB (radical SAM superfamily)
MSFICKAPWTSIAFQPTGVAPCCMYQLDELEEFRSDGKLFQKIRDSFTDGIVPTGCVRCSSRVNQGNEESAYFKSFNHYTTNFSTQSIQEINLRSNNFCNLACRSCGPHFSSKWEKEFKETIVITKDSDVFSKIDTLDLSVLKTIVFAGGEPTIVPEHVQLLKKLISINHTRVNIRVATNLQTLTNKNVNLIDLWKNFPNLILHISIDAVGNNAVNIRSGTNWETMVSNIEKVSKNNIDFNFAITVSALNIWFLEKTLDYLTETFPKNNKLLQLLNTPDILDISVIPPKYRDSINQMLKSCQQKKYEVNHIKHYFDNNDTSQFWQNFLTYNLFLDVNRQENFCQSLPIYDQLMIDWVHL